MKPQDIIAIVIIVGGMGLLYFGRDGTIAAMLLGVTAFYFGLNSLPPKV